MRSLLWCVISRASWWQRETWVIIIVVTSINLRLVRDYFSILFLVIVNISELDATNANVLGKMML